mmetsp:Transcript_11386/g.25919  ORF Transcript_11386/g.25919 Transcript_11386/m.25919 type:complete len:439 (-) Transcript_11386:145-1461(-)
MNDQLAAVRKNQQDRWRSRPSNDPSSSRSKGGNGDKGHDEDDDEDDVICLSPPVQTSTCNYNDEVVCLGTCNSSSSLSSFGLSADEIAGILGNKRNLSVVCLGSSSSSAGPSADEIAEILRNKRKHITVVDLGSSSSSFEGLSAGVAGTLRNKRKHLSVDDDASFDECKKHTGVVAKAGGGGSYTLTDSHPRVHEDGGWLWVNDPCYKKNRPLECRVDESGDVMNLMVQFNRLRKKEGKTKITHDFVLELAKENGVLHGKWIVWFSPKHVVEGWTKIRNSLLNGELGPTAKISTSPERGSHVVCVYCPNFTDSAELLRIRRGISSAGIATNSVLRFKTDAFTYLGIYANNEWKLRTTSFDCGGKNDPECKVLSYAEETCSGRVGCKKCFPCCLVVQEENEAKMAEEEKKRRALVKPLFPSWSQIDTRRAKPKFTFVEG